PRHWFLVAQTRIGGIRVVLEFLDGDRRADSCGSGHDLLLIATSAKLMVASAASPMISRASTPWRSRYALSSTSMRVIADGPSTITAVATCTAWAPARRNRATSPPSRAPLVPTIASSGPRAWRVLATHRSASGNDHRP